MDINVSGEKILLAVYHHSIINSDGGGFRWQLPKKPLTSLHSPRVNWHTVKSGLE